MIETMVILARLVSYGAKELWDLRYCVLETMNQVLQISI
ncbi:hypothetical protein WKK_00105 [Weissella koreensis KACC 15510]|nr:hypothetical protein WKK_00105 [Weissella koreensis KACC 15510]